ncbi:Rossmann-like and DUF2520 domain-containing protein [Rarobacter incanus]|uniref:Putative short-subunit dehydrogenase-like oxidoreductase (DUF2520 family) n=1 Tax=Rarobacter incanus TaxID=153494 RepID=A0A542SP70_9MICO|nr:DUF2520 domain-containing protein [Rarobacter incanus]TQK76358.1 putative short-subunit dehydrogenase-like oxidoreductase (DUF2520 family) [Rarobacter incanus]
MTESVQSRAPKPGRMGVGVIGAGRVGPVLGSALRAAGHSIVGINAGSDDSRQRAQAMLPGVPLLSAQQVVERCEVVLLAVPDDAIADLVAGLAATTGWQLGQIVVHVSGAHALDILEPATKQGAIGLAIHPAMTFTGTSIDIGRMVGTSFAVTAPAPFLPIAQAMVVEMGGEPVVVDPRARVAYHAALTHAANHAVTLVSQATEVLRAAGIENPGTLLSHLVHASVEGALRYASDGADPMLAVTGPAVRADVGTLAGHVDVMRASEHTDLADAYLTMARSTALRAFRAGRLSERGLMAVLDVLGSTPSES